LSNLAHVVILCGRYEGVDERVLESERATGDLGRPWAIRGVVAHGDARGEEVRSADKLRGEARLGSESFRIVARRAQQRAGSFVADAVVCEQRSRDRVEDLSDGVVEFGDLGVKSEPTTRDHHERAFRATGRGERIAGPEPGSEFHFATSSEPA
jgi:hypothetical protein